MALNPVNVSVSLLMDVAIYLHKGDLTSLVQNQKRKLLDKLTLNLGIVLLNLHPSINAFTQLLPLFYDRTTTATVIKHRINVLWRGT